MIFRFILSVLCLLLVQEVIAQSDENEDILNDFEAEEWKEPTKGHPGFFGAGGVLIQMIQPDLKNLNEELQLCGLTNFKNQLILYGGQGFGSYKKFRFGFFGFGGAQWKSKTVKDTLPNNLLTDISRTATISTGGFGITGGYRITLPKSFEIEPSLWFTFGTLTLKYVQSSKNPDWADIWNENNNNATNVIFRETTIHSNYYLTQPGCFIRYYPTMWSAVGIGLQYIIPIKDPTSWKFHSESIRNAKSVKMSSPQYTLQFLFGL
ncbi:MAG: hypothetical protein N2450_08970 [bacterium]|nr:hypothetical protein [bacterium]